MKYSLKLLLFSLSLFLTVTAATVNKAIARDPSENLASARSSDLVENTFEIAQNRQNREINAFVNSKYDYWDAKVLSSYWKQSVFESKTRIGRKVLWGEANIAILEQYLVDARIAALTGTVQNPIDFFSQSGYTYNDAKKLAKFWGDPSPYDAKLRIGRNLILGQQEVVERAMQEARGNPW